jgi:hypothetical protein
MKKLLLLATGLMFTQLQAQTALSNAGFETWNTVLGSTAEEPAGWITGNLATSSLLPGAPMPNTNPVSVTKVTDVTEGSYALRVETVTLTFNPAPDYVPNTGGIAFIGTPIVNLSPPSLEIKAGFAVTAFDPVSFSFDAKYTPVNSDNALVSLFLTHWNGTQSDTIATAIQSFSSAVANYTPNVVNFTYNPLFTGVSADTCMIAIASSDPDGTPEVGSAIYVDNLAFTLPAGIRASLSEDGYMVYPNPAKDKLIIQGINHHVASVKVLTLEGREILSSPLNAQNFSTESLQEGMYVLQIFNKENQLVSTKRFSVKR